MKYQDILPPEILSDTIALTADAHTIQQFLQQVESSLRKDSLAQQATAAGPIPFFKDILPLLFGKYLHALTILDLTLFLPAPIGDRHLRYLNRVLTEAETYRRQHAALYKYYKLRLYDNDSHYFLPTAAHADQTVCPSWMVPFLPLPDATLTYSRFHADELTDAWVMNNFTSGSLPKNQPSTLRWTGSLAALTELLYGLNEMGVFGAGRQEISKLKMFFEKAFSVSLGNVYKTYEHNRIRKKSRTPFTDALKAALTRRMEEDDLNAL